MKSKNLLSIFGAVFAFTMLMGTTSCGKAEAPDQGVLRAGSWIEYGLEMREGSRTGRGTLRVSVLERKKVEEEVLYWIELKQVLDQETEITRFLAAENEAFDLKTQFEPWIRVKEVIIQKGQDRPQRVPEVQVKKYAPRFVESAKTKRFGNAEDLHPPKTGTLAARSLTVQGKSHQGTGRRIERTFVSKVNLGFIHMEDTTEAVYGIWTAPDLPLGGLLALEYESGTTSVNKLKPDASPGEPQIHQIKLTLKDFGAKGAVSELTGEPEAMQAPAFPFLKGNPSGERGGGK